MHSPPKDVLEKLVNSISNKIISKRSESPVSNAIYNPEHVRLLLQAGFDPNHQNEFGKTPLYYAIQFNQHDSVRVSLEHGANVNHEYQLEKDNKWHCLGISQWNRTPLMHAAQHADTDMIKLLLENQANLHVKDALGFDVLVYAKKNSMYKNESFLQQMLNSKSK